MVVTAVPVVKEMRQTSPTGTDPVTLTHVTRHSGSGFTLVELLLVLGLIAVLAAVLAPMLLPSAARTLQETADQIGTGLRETRRTARATKAVQQFVVDTENGRYRSPQSPGWRELPQHMTLELTTAQSLLTSAGTGAIAFNPDGSSSGGQIVVGLGGHGVQIDVAWLTGRIHAAEVTP